MKLFDKIKGLFSKKNNDTSVRTRVVKYVCLGLLATSNVTAITVATIAWFSLNTRESKIAMVSGDLDVEINKVTAYKYVYPYYKGTTEYVNYDSPGVVKQYILEDHVMKYDNKKLDDIEITSDDATVVLGAKAGGTTSDYYTTSQGSASASKVYIPSANYEPEFRYYLIGDGIFCGVSNSWSITDAYAFASQVDIDSDQNGTTAILDDVVIPVGSSFRLLETVKLGNDYAYRYFPISSITESKSPFRVTDSNNKLLCLRSGIYKFTYSKNQLKIELHKKDNGTRKDISVITNNSLDPTKVTIDYAGGSVNKTDPNKQPYYGQIEDYLPTAIYNQNTSLVLDVELNFKNANPVEAGLEIERTAYDANDTSINSIYSLDNRYSDTTHNLNGYVNDNQKNMMRASDFYNFYALFTKTPFSTTEALWSTMHRTGDNQCQKFSNIEEDENENPRFDKKITCTMHLKDQNDSTVIPGIYIENQNSSSSSETSMESSSSEQSASSSSQSANIVENIYHCYVSIEYDYQHSQYFLNKNRLGKTYLLDRDFGFHFFGTQHKEVAQNNNGSSL